MIEEFASSRGAPMREFLDLNHARTINLLVSIRLRSLQRRLQDQTSFATGTLEQGSAKRSPCSRPRDRPARPRDWWPGADGVVGHRQDARRACAQGPLRPRPHHHHRADRAAGKRGRVRVHGAPLEPGDAAPVGGDCTRHGRGGRSLRGAAPTPSESRLAELAADQVRAVDDRHGARRTAADAAQAVLRSARPGAVGGDRHARQAPVLDRHGRPTCGTSRSASSSTTPSCASPRRAR